MNEPLERANHSNWKRATADEQQRTTNESFADEPLKLWHFVKNWLRPATETEQITTTANWTNEPNERANEFLKAKQTILYPYPYKQTWKYIKVSIHTSVNWFDEKL